MSCPAATVVRGMVKDGSQGLDSHPQTVQLYLWRYHETVYYLFQKGIPAAAPLHDHFTGCKRRTKDQKVREDDECMITVWEQTGVHRLVVDF